ncbi:MAG: twin-arginine translocase subunit TatB [Syntrophomonadaceae bacterium]|nr:twin-arginine translocase subunit TatB [Syntrophomonadaceae bacterium]
MFGFIGNIGPWEIVLILLIALIVVGPGKLPEVAKSVGKAMNEFKKATTGVKREFENALKVDDDSASKTDKKQEAGKTNNIKSELEETDSSGS